MLDPVAVALKFGFLAVLYLFLFWMARSALKDLRQSAGPAGPSAGPDPPVHEEEGTGFHSAATGMAPEADGGVPVLRVLTAAGLREGAAYDLSEGAVLGRSDQADIRLEDSFASGRHTELAPHGDAMVVEDLGSTNGTYLNGTPLSGPQPLRPGDRIRIGDSEFAFER